MNDENEVAASVFEALADPRSLRLLLHVLQVGTCGDTVGHDLGMTQRAAVFHLERLSAAGLLVRAEAASEASSYRVSDAAAVERLLAMVRSLGRPARDRP